MAASKAFAIITLLSASLWMASAEVTKLDEGNFSTNLDDHSKVFFIKFFAPWCGHCKRLAPTWDELSEKVKGNVVIAHVDCTENRELCEKHEIRGYPTLKAFVKGTEHQSYSGARDLESLQNFIEDIAGSLDD